MKVSLSWLKEYTSVDIEPSEMAAKLTMAGLEVESFYDRYAYLDKVVVARVVETRKHPNADKLTCCSVNVGNDEIKNIVCGAPNVREGLVVPCALIGAVLPGDFKIKKSKLRGEVSEGMLCSSSELKLDSIFSGIMELDQGLVPGTALADALGLSDYIFDIDLTPNRPDCLSMTGVAREIAAFKRPAAELVIPRAALDEIKNKEASLIDDFAKVDIIDADLCPRYAAGLVLDVKVKPSPFWLRQRLESIEMTPVNNIVDITNFVMMETGQPLHAFDFDLISHGRIEVRKAGDDKKFTTLDGKEHDLEPDMLMICDGEGPVAIAGVMGGENSEISEKTTRVLVESAYFNPVSVRKTSKRSGIITDASHRFERGVDPCNTKNALERALALMADIAGGSIVQGIIDEHPVKNPRTEIMLDINSLNKRLGTDFSSLEISEFLESVEFGITRVNDTVLKVIVPCFRVDVSRPEDLSEEVARLWGYDNIKTSFPEIPAQGGKLSPVITLRENIKEIMNGFGFSEAVNYSFTSPDFCDKLLLDSGDKKRSVEKILNPISEEMAVLRTSLLPGLLDTMRRNNYQQIDDLKIFETGHVFFAKRKGVQPEEKEMMAALWTGAKSELSWHSKKIDSDFFDIKGAVEGLLNGLGVFNAVFSRADEKQFPYFKKGYAAVITKGGEQLGSIGQIDSLVLNNFSLKQDAFVFDIDVENLLKVLPESINASAIPKFPSLSRDITIIVDKEIEAGAVISEINGLMEKNPLIEDVFLFDVYEGKPLLENKKSLSLRVVYRSWEKTLKEKMVKGVHNHISKLIIKKFRADLP